MSDQKLFNDTKGDDTIVPVTIETEMKKSYLDYAMSVIVSRAIPDVCDGLKPVHRRILYAMHEGNYDYNKPFKKSARIVGEVMGKYHPHGDSAIYESLVRMAQDFSMRLPLVDGQGNFGSIDADPPAAMRYTESRLEKVSHVMLDDLDKDTVDFVPNYDGSEKEPRTMPSKFPNLLVNGSGGIAVGMATNIPPHNLGEVIDATIQYIDNPELTFEELLQIVPGPDFPTGGIILGRSGHESAVRTGRGSVVMRGVANVEEGKKGRESIIISEIPYQVNKAKLVEKIADLVNEKKIEGISDLRDESNREGIRIVIELKRDAMPEVILNQLYNFTQLQENFSVNMLALHHGKPQSMNMLQVISAFADFRENVVTRRTNFLLGKARSRAHIVIGLFAAVDNIDEIVALIRSSRDSVEAKDKLMGRSWSGRAVEALIALVSDENNKIEDGKFYFTETQAKAILDMRLARLTGLEGDKLKAELEELAAEITKYLEILGDRNLLLDIIKNELKEVKEEFATPRRTQVEESEFEHSMEDLIPKEDMVVIVTLNGYIKRVPLSTYRSQKRGGKGRSGISIRDEDITTDVFVTNTHTPILFFSDNGKVYRMKTYKLPAGNPQSKGRALVNLLPIDQNDKISTILTLPEDEAEWSDLNIVFSTSLGQVRRNSMADFTNIQSNGKIAIKLEGDEKLVNVHLSGETDDVLVASRTGKCIRFPLSALRVFKSRSSSGVRGIKLESGNEAIAMSILGQASIDMEIREKYLKLSAEKRLSIKEALIAIEKAKEEPEDKGQEDLLAAVPEEIKVPDGTSCGLSQEQVEELAKNEQFILTITENGFGKRSSAYEYRITNRGGVGITNIVTSKRNGDVVASFPVDNDDHIIMITNKGTLIRTPVSSVRISGRNTQGVTLIKTKSKDENVVSVARIAASAAQDNGYDEAEDGEEGEVSAEEVTQTDS